MDSDNMEKYVNGFLDYLKLEKNYSDNTIQGYYKDLLDSIVELVDNNNFSFL